MAVQVSIGLNKASTQPKNAQQDAVYLRALLEMEGISGLTIRRLVNEAGSLSAVWNASDAFLATQLSLKRQLAFKQRRDKGLQDDWLEIYQKLDVRPLPFTDPAYPTILKETHDPPLLLYTKGHLSAWYGNTLAVVGTRHATIYGKQATEVLIQQLKPYSPVIVSGLAQGIDTVAHKAAIESNFATVAVFGCGLDVVYPASNRGLCKEIIAHGGLLVSEYPLGTMPTKYTFPQRNRIVAGLSQGVLMVEGDLKSGALITARLGLEEGRSIFAVPGNIFTAGSQGPLHLIQQGALAISSGEDIAKELNWLLLDEEGDHQARSLSPKPMAHSKSDSEKEPLRLPLEVLDTISTEERAVLQCIPFDSIAIEDIQQTCGLPSAKINQCLTMLELEGLIVLLPGAKVCRKQRY